MRLIDADALKEAIEKNGCRHSHYFDVFDVIDKSPTIEPTLDIWEKIVDYEHCDNVFVEQHSKRYIFIKEKKSKWISDVLHNTVCSTCGGIRRDNRVDHINFCNKCGADMKGDET